MFTRLPKDMKKKIIGYRTEAIRYILKEGDTYEALAEKYKTSVDDIIEANPELDQSSLKVGEIINIPIMQSQSDEKKLGTIERVTKPVLINNDNINKGLYPVLNYKPGEAEAPYIYVPIAEFRRVGAKVKWNEEKQLLSVTTDYFKMERKIKRLKKQIQILKSMFRNNLNEENGSTFGNIMNSGLAAKKDDWVYFRNTRVGDSLYKIKDHGTTKYRLNNDRTYYINVVGDWIYYLNHSDEDKIYKIKNDGTERTKIVDDKSYFINVIGDWIYYQNRSDGNKIYKIKIDGTKRTKINDDYSSCFNIIDDWIYYQNESDNNKPYKVKTDGIGRTKVNDESTNCMNVVGKWIYYINTLDNDKLYKIKIDGTEKTKLNDVSTTSIIVSDGWIYYEFYQNGEIGYLVHKTRLDGTGDTKLLDGVGLYFNVLDNCIYYVTAIENYVIRKKTDGTLGSDIS